MAGQLDGERRPVFWCPDRERVRPRDTTRPMREETLADVRAQPSGDGFFDASGRRADGSARIGLASATPAAAHGGAVTAPDRALEPAGARALDEHNEEGSLRRLCHTLTAPPWLLLAVLAVQSALSLRLVWSNTAFNDEGLYLWAGRWEIAHLLHGTKVPQFQTFFSGSPVIYPVLGAIADGYGGLTAARLLSMAFMLGATVLLYGTTARLFGRRAGVIAAAVFAFLGPVQFLGAFATFDAMAIFLLAFATWLVVLAKGWASEPLLILAGLVLALADATKYPAGLWNPVVIALAVLLAARGGWVRAVLRGLRLAAYCAAAILVALFRYGGPAYLHALLHSTLIRDPSSVPMGAIMRNSAVWVGLILVIALRGILIADTTRSRLLSVTLAGAVALAPLEQARIHTQTALNKHVAFGAWFGAIAAGYVLARAIETSRYAKWRIAAGTALFIMLAGFLEATSFFAAWPNSRAMVDTMRPFARSAHSPLLAEQGAVAGYYLRLPPERLANTFAFSYWDPAHARELTGIPAYRQAIRDHYFGLVEVDFSFSARTARDNQIVAMLRDNPGYRLVTSIPWRDRFGHGSFMIWRYAGTGGNR